MHQQCCTGCMPRVSMHDQRKLMAAVNAVGHVHGDGWHLATHTCPRSTPAAHAAVVSARQCGEERGRGDG